jgi:hypothetical protein
MKIYEIIKTNFFYFRKYYEIIKTNFFFYFRKRFEKI